MTGTVTGYSGRHITRLLLIVFGTLAVAVAVISAWAASKYGFGESNFLRYMLDFDTVIVEEEVPVAASLDHSAWLVDGKVYLAGEELEGQEAAGTWKDLVQVAVSDTHVVALDELGHVHAAGDNTSQQCTADGFKGVTYIAAGRNCTAVVTKKRTVRVFGILEDPFLQGLAGETNVRKLVIGDELTAVLHTNGTVTVYQMDNSLDLSAVGSWTNIRQVAVGRRFVAGLDGDGIVLFAGENPDGEQTCVGWQHITDIAGGTNSVVGLKSDGTVVAAGANRNHECDVSEWTNIAAIAASYDHTAAIGKDQSLFAVGYNRKGQCDIPQTKH